MLSSMKFTNFLFQILSALIDQIRFFNELVRSIIDQSQEYYSFNDGPLIIIWCKRTVNKFNWPVNCPAVTTPEKEPIESMRYYY